MTATAPTPEPRPWLPIAPSPSVFDRMADDAIAEIREAQRNFRWLYGSAYAKGRRETHERVRRNVSGTTGDVASALIGQESVRHHIDQAGKYMKDALAHLKGTNTALAKAQDKIDRASKPTLVAADPLEPAERPGPQGMTPSEARKFKAQREARVAASQSPFATEELYG